MPNNLIEYAKKYAINAHRQTNHTYGDGVPYSVHLQMVSDYAHKYLHLIPEEAREEVLASCWTHDVIEDCRKTYNDVKENCGMQVAEITYALTNEKGRNRAARANLSYYEGIRAISSAVFVKICDRLANIAYSKENSSSMLAAYKKEEGSFYSQLYTPEFAEMFNEYSTLLS